MFTLETNKPVAIDSNDHINPHGTANDNSKNMQFVQVITKYYGRSAKVIDIGSAGGGLIEDFVNNNHLAIGIEGSDYSAKIGRAAWNKLYNKNLFTCDVTEPFQIKYNDINFVADVITLWEVWEHFKEDKIPQVIDNILKHLRPGGLLVGTISCSSFGNEPWHQCVQPPEWWDNLFAKDFRFDPYIKKDMDELHGWVREINGHFCCHKRI